MLKNSKAASRLPFLGVPKSSEQHVPKWKIGIIEGVQPFLVVDAMALRPLKNVSEPVGRANIPVVDKLRQTSEKNRERSGLGRETDDQVQ